MAAGSLAVPGSMRAFAWLSLAVVELVMAGPNDCEVAESFWLGFAIVDASLDEDGCVGATRNGTSVVL